MEIICLVEYWQNNFIWLSVTQNPLMYLHSLSLYTSPPCREFFSCCISPALWGRCAEPPQCTGTCKPQQTTCLKGKEHWKRIFVAKPDLGKQKFIFPLNKILKRCKYLNIKYGSALKLTRNGRNLACYGFQWIQIRVLVQTWLSATLWTGLPKIIWFGLHLRLSKSASQTMTDTTAS